MYLSLLPKHKSSRSKITSLLWHGAEPAKSRHSLSQLLLTIKNAVPTLRLGVAEDAIWLDSPISSDVGDVAAHCECRELESALATYEGPFFENVELPGSEFEDWRSQQQGLIIRQIEDALISRLYPAFIKGDLRTCESLVTQTSQRLGDYWDGTCLPSDISFDKSKDLPQALHNPLIGRNAELLTLYEEYKAMRLTGRGCVVAIEGEAGIGKTTIVDTFVDAVRRAETPTIVIRGFEPELGSGLRVLKELLRNSFVSSHVDTLPRHTRDLLSHISGKRTSSVMSDEARHFLFEAVRNLLSSICQKHALVICLDDLQWFDSSSMELVRVMCRMVDQVPLQLVIASRPHPTSHGGSDVSSGRFGKKLDIAPLSKTEIGEIFREPRFSATRGKAIAAIWKRTAGHPYLIGELLKEIHKNGSLTLKAIRSASPSTLTKFVRSQYSGVSKEAQILLCTLATLGKPTSHKIVRRATPLSSGEFVIGVRELIECNILSDNRGVFRCTHDLVRENVYASLSYAQKRILHGRCAQTLESAHAPTADILYHFRRAGMRGKVYTAALREAQRYGVIGAAKEADHSYRLALLACKSQRKRDVLVWRRARTAYASGLLSTAKRLFVDIRGERPTLYQRHQTRIEYYLADIERELGLSDSAAVRAASVSVATLAKESQDIETQVDAIILKARAHLLDGAADEAGVLDAIRDLGTVAEQAGPSAKVAAGMGWAAGALVLMGRKNEAISMIDQASGLCERGHYGAIAHIETSKCFLHAYTGDLRNAIACGIVAAEHAEASGLWRLRKNVLGTLVGILVEAGQDASAEETVNALLRTVSVDEALPHLCLAYMNYSLLTLARSEYDRARRYAEQGLRIGSALDRPWGVAYATALIGLCALEMGSFSEAQRHRDTVLSLDGKYFGNDELPMHKLISRVAEIEGQTDWAIARLNQAVQENFRLSATCRAGLEIELARLIGKRDRPQAWNIAMSVRSRSKEYGAIRLAEAAEALVTRFEPRSLP